MEGLALPMFIMAVLGNVAYALGILLYSVQLDFIILRLPWLVGSVGTVCFDFTVSLDQSGYISFAAVLVTFVNQLKWDGQGRCCYWWHCSLTCALCYLTLHC